jgi:hypothetical protein
MNMYENIKDCCMYFPVKSGSDSKSRTNIGLNIGGEIGREVIFILDISASM